MTESALDRVLLAAGEPTSHFNTEVVRSAWQARCERRRQALSEAQRALEETGSPRAYRSPAEEDPICFSHVRQLWTDHLIIEAGDDNATYRVPFSVSAPGTTSEHVEFGTPTRVVETFVAASQQFDMDLIHLSADELAEAWSGLVALSSHRGWATLAGPPVAERRELAKEGKARPDGSFPIPNVSYLKKAIKALGRAKDYNSALRWIKKRARALGRTDLVEHLKPKGAG